MTYTKRIANIGRFLLTLLFAALTVGGFCLIIYSWSELKIDLKKTAIKQLLIVFPLILEYFLFAFTFICLTAFFKNGFNNVNSFDRGGVIAGFFGGLYFWTYMGILCLLLGGMIFLGISGIISVIIIVLPLGLLFGIGGFFKEIKDQQSIKS